MVHNKVYPVPKVAQYLIGILRSRLVSRKEMTRCLQNPVEKGLGATSQA